MNRRGFISSVIGGLASAVAAPFVGRAATPTAITSINGLPDKYAVKSEWFKNGYDPNEYQILMYSNGEPRWATVAECGYIMGNPDAIGGLSRSTNA